MEKEIRYALDKVISTLNDNKNVIRIRLLKNIIEQDEKIKALVKEYNDMNDKADNSTKLIDIKKRLYNIPLYKEYTDSLNELSYFVMFFNNKMSSLLDDKKCRFNN